MAFAVCCVGVTCRKHNTGGRSVFGTYSFRRLLHRFCIGIYSVSRVSHAKKTQKQCENEVLIFARLEVFGMGRMMPTLLYTVFSHRACEWPEYSHARPMIASALPVHARTMIASVLPVRANGQGFHAHTIAM